MKFLIILVVILAVAAIAQAVRVHELAKKLSNKREEDVSVADNDLNANLWIVSMIALMGSFFYLIFRYKDAMLPEAASIHGESIDQLMDFNLWLVSIVFVVMNVLLMVFAWKYRYKLGKKAFYYPHNDRLELIWTVIPALTMAVIIIYGLNVWNDTMSNDDVTDQTINIELYAKQFDWSARYGGEDNILGPSSFNFISGTNPLGVITKEVFEGTMTEIDTQIATLKASLENDILSYTAEEETREKIERLKRHKVRVLGYDQNNPEFEFSKDDIVADKGVFYIPVNREVLFHVNSRDVIHSAFMPHFRMQMNAVPGMTTTFRMTPTITTAEMKKKTGNEDFDYILLCNKICGAAHYNMKMTVKVVEEDEYTAWLNQQSTFVPQESPDTEGLAEN
ncbi:MAG: cytochrome c oxidase subunit II [Flavobacteriales bacterium]|nr:cytochrome c oxidase subunit II [Flavobacteriales bacterium]